MHTYDISGSLLRTEYKTYVGGFQLPPDIKTVLDNGQTSQSTHVYLGGLLGDKYDYDYGPGAVGILLKHTHIDYAAFGNTPIFSSAPSLVDRPSDVLEYDGIGNKMAETDYAYDGTGVSSLPSATGHDETNYSTSNNSRGNATTKTVKCLQSGCSNAVTTYTYDETGQVTSRTDPCGNGTCNDMNGTTHVTNYSYADSYTVLSGGQNVPCTSGCPSSGTTNAFLTKITDPLGHTGNFMYDYNNSQLTKSTDANSQSTTYIYNDPFARATQVNDRDGGQTQATYTDVQPSPSVTTCQLINGTAGATCSSTSPPAGWKTTVASMDGMGNLVQTALVSDPDGPTYAATTYDGTGNAYQVYDPTRCSPPTTNCNTETTWGYTTYLYDSLGRTKQVTKPDGSVATTSFSGSSTTVTDEVGNQRTSQTDGLGRLTAVFEAPNNSGYNYQTDYQYDALGNLTCAVQKGTDTTTFTSCASASATWRPRSFAYDSLSRLTSATNPESGTITYTYDPNSNLATKIQPKAGQTGTLQTTHNYTYDVLNRLLQDSHVDPSAGTDKYAYDGSTLTSCGQNPPTITSPTNLIGRRSAMCSQKSGSSWSFDPMGRPLLESTRNLGSTQKVLNVSYTYSMNGSLSTLTYPSGDLVTYTQGDAGRSLGVGDSSNSYVASGTTNRATYAPGGALASMTNGYTGPFAGIVTLNIYNDRLQPISLSAKVGSNAVFSLCYDFHLGVATGSPCNINAYTTGDNGNIFQLLNKWDPTRSAAFAYDPLNRISQANTTNTTSSNCWGETYTIDPWGNLTNRAGVSGMGACYTEGLNVAPASAKNQLNGPLYDAAGNVTNDGNGNTPTYDAENRIATDAGSTYSYDADGTRMEKSSGSSGAMYWPGPGGEVLTETDLTGTINEEYVYFNGERIARVDRPSGTVHYYFSNHLGSASVITDALGNIQLQTDYYPFGGIAYTSGSDPGHYKFTGKERDAESGLDNFGARYMASTMGRFMQTDPDSASPLHLVNPQRWNAYAYVLNNPLAYTDPDGRDAAAVNFSSMVGGAGHEGVMAIDSDGTVTYAEFGPASHGAGNLGGAAAPGVVNIDTNLPKVQFGSDHQPTPESMQAVKAAIAKNDEGGVDPNTVRVNYFQTSDADTMALKNWMREQQEAAQRGQGPFAKYRVWGSQNCATFCVRGLVAGNALTNTAASSLSIVPNGLYWELLGLQQSKPLQEQVTHKICYTDDNGKQVCQ